jgi:DNA-binding beta-propeller fold protein YncE
LPSLYVPEFPRDVEYGQRGQLYVLGTDTISQIDAVTGAPAGPDVGSSWMVYSGEMAISPDRQTLYYADYGLSPASLYQFDVSGDEPNLLWESPHGGHGSNGQDLALSHDGSFISYACGYGQGGYQIAKYLTSNMAIEGVFPTGAYPREITFSPDDAVAYTVHTSGLIDTWSTSTFLTMGTISTTGEAAELMVDRSAQHLFAAFTPYSGDPVLRVYDTGRVPEPGTLTALLLIAGAYCLRGDRRSCNT